MPKIGGYVFGTPAEALISSAKVGAMTQGMRAASAGNDAYSREAIMDYLGEGLSADRSDGRMQRKEEAAPEARRTGLPYVPQNGIADIR